MERWVYDSDSGRPGRRRGLFVWLLDAAFAVVTALVALLLLFMYLAPYVSPDASWVFSVLGLVAPVIYVSGLVLFLYWVKMCIRDRCRKAIGCVTRCFVSRRSS